MAGKYELKVKGHIDAAHYLKDYDGPCKNVHGHRWDVEVVIIGNRLSACNMLIDFKVVKDMMKGLIAVLDHNGFINDNLHTDNPTAEFIAKWFYEQMTQELCLLYESSNTDGLKVYAVSIWESPECCVKYYEQDDKRQRSVLDELRQVQRPHLVDAVSTQRISMVSK